MMATITFQSFPATTSVTFDCPECGGKSRKRSFRHECTVNPFNKNEDGSMKTPSEVAAQSRYKAETERKQFLRAPLCKTCENKKTWTERQSIIKARRSPTEQELEEE